MSVITLAQTLADVYADVAASCDGSPLVQSALGKAPLIDDLAAALGRGRPTHVLALGKVALPMLHGLLVGLATHPGPPAIGTGLVVTTNTQAARVVSAAGQRPAAYGPLPDRFALLPADHPIPGHASLRAGHAVREFVRGVPPGEPLIVLLSGGGSALAALPAGTLSLADKVGAITALAKSGASIRALNTVRKHLSAIKGGQLAAAARGPVIVLALSDVVGDDPSVIASGPFFPDPTRYADAVALLQAHAPHAPAPAFTHLRAGMQGLLPDTPKPGSIAPAAHHIVAGPAHVVTAAWNSARARGLVPSAGEENTEAAVETLARTYANHPALARAVPADIARAVPAQPRIIIGNGEPRVVLPADRAVGRGGRATHLALLMAKALHGRVNGADVAFLAAGTDEHDGSSGAAGAVVDGNTWRNAQARGLDPQAALDRHDSAALLDQLGALVHGPGRSNLLDLHLLACSGPAP